MCMTLRKLTVKTFDNELEAYSLAYELAMKNASAWKAIARLALELGFKGQAYSVAVTAYEEIGKAYISWLASKEVIPLDDEILELVYHKHVAKTLVSDLISFEDALLLSLGSGIISVDNILKELSVTSEEEALERLAIKAIEREDRRRLGMYVDVREEDMGHLSITSPDDISEKRAGDAIEEVENTHELLEILLRIYEDHPPLLEIFKNNYKERMDDLSDSS